LKIALFPLHLPALGHGQTANHVRGDGSFPRKQPLRPFCTMRA
jgi:hypothetical protein